MFPLATVSDAFRDTAQRQAERPFLQVLPETAARYGIAAETLTYAAALAQIDALAQRYAEAGYGHGHRVGLLLENRVAFFLHWLALNSLGASVVPINADLRAAELEYLIEHSEICLAVTLPQRAADLQAAAAASGSTLATMPPDALAVPRADRAPPYVGTPDSDSECALLYTSGTTGRPKGCVLPNDYYLLAGTWYNRIGGLCSLREGEERLITPLPMVHMNAMAYSTMAMIMSGGCVIPLDRFHPASWWSSVRESAATIVHYLGVMPALLLAAPPSELDRTHAVRFGFGAGVDKTLHAAFETRFGFPLLEAWAMTETGAGAVIIANHEPRHVGTACFGRPEAQVAVRIVDDHGRDVPADTPGELLVRAAGDDPRRGFFRAYLKDEAATRAAWAGGWFHTGDVVRADAQGHLYFVDRRKNVIRRSGENISAVEVEAVLRQHALVSNVGVAPVPDALRGDEVAACVVPARALTPEEMPAAAQELVAHCLARLAYYKAPGYVAFVDRLPLTSTQKIQRGAMQDVVAQVAGTPSCMDTRHLKKRTG
ncbi:MAG: AMP-binding protein [Burkholderiales bacterium]|nr:AMP-binding protein [Burkholderiales bacterium]